MTAKKTELYSCESQACPSYGSEIKHEVQLISDYEARYKVLICPKCEIRTFIVLKYHPRFWDTEVRQPPVAHNL